MISKMGFRLLPSRPEPGTGLEWRTLYVLSHCVCSNRQDRGLGGNPEVVYKVLELSREMHLTLQMWILMLAMPLL